ncbi:MAG: hypothetical protein NWE99_10965 [Candidatus Bathyarchaeota archaeon]|nr:hypothetical protein [Candidatus Bathyarchaeota archaeon]
MLGLRDKSSVWLLEFDYQLLTREMEDAEETREEKVEKMREWVRRRRGA